VGGGRGGCGEVYKDMREKGRRGEETQSNQGAAISSSSSSSSTSSTSSMHSSSLISPTHPLSLNHPPTEHQPEPPYRWEAHHAIPLRLVLALGDTASVNDVRARLPEQEEGDDDPDLCVCVRGGC
jgi:hypothetical protein